METPAPMTAPSPPELGPKPWGLPAVLLGLILPVLLWGSSLALSIAADTEEELSNEQIVAGLVLTIILDAVLIALAVGLSAYPRRQLAWGELGLRPFDRDFWWLPLVGAAGAHVGIILYGTLLTLVGADAAIPEQEDLDQLFQSRAVLPLTGVATVLMAPLAEEIFFRGFVFAGLIRPFGLAGAMVTSGFLFGAFHISGPETVGLLLPFGLIGMFFAWLYYRTGSLWITISTHFLFNLVSFIILASTVGAG